MMANNEEEFIKPEKRDFIVGLAGLLDESGAKMSVPMLAELLNFNEYFTESGEPYDGKRGTYHLIRSIFDQLKAEKRDDEAGMVATVFVKPDGELAWSD